MQEEKKTVRKLTFEEPDYVYDKIWLGPEKSTINKDYLIQNNIRKILCVAAFCETEERYKDDKDIKAFTINVDDSPLENLRQYFD